MSIAVLACAAPAASAHTRSGGISASAASTPASPVAPVAPAAPSLPTATGGQTYGQGNPAATELAPGQVATILPDGLAAAPADAPQQVQDAIAAANEIIGLPYIYGGGHNARFSGKGYDCSGTVSYMLHGGDLLDSPLDSSSFMHWGARGRGTWFTIYTNPSHAFAVVAGLRLDTSAAGDPSGLKGPRWRPVLRSTRGFHARHPIGF